MTRHAPGWNGIVVAGVASRSRAFEILAQQRGWVAAAGGPPAVSPDRVS
jgi:hypothetical protein